MKHQVKVQAVAIVATLLGATSAIALERAAPQQFAQAEPDEKGGGGAGGREDRGDRGGGGGGERPAARDGGGDGGGERPQRQRQRDDDGGGAAAGGASGNDDGPPRKKERAKDDDGPPQKKAAPADDEPAPKAEKKAPPAVKKEPPAEKAAPEPAEKSEPDPEPKPKPKPEPKPEAKEPPPQAKEPDEAKDAAPKQAPKSDVPAKEAPPKQPVEKDAPPKGDEKGPDAKGRDSKGPDSKRPDAKEDAGPAKGPDAAQPGATPPPAKDGPVPKDGAVAPAPAGQGAAQPAAPSEVKDLKELKEERKERKEDGGKRVIIEEPDKRVIVKEGGKTIIRHDETERFRRLDRNTRREKRNGLDISISVGPSGIEIYTETDDRGRPLRRYRRDRDGREVNYFDNREYYRRHRDDNFIDAVIDLPPPRMSIPRDDYIVDYEEASDVDVYEALSAPPVEELDRTYSMEEVRRSPQLRDRMRRVDLDAINFEFGAWDVTSDQFPKLERVASAMKRVIDRNTSEMFLIEGHTDAVGSDEDNLSLSDRRAESVAIILTEEFGIPPENLTTQGYGEQFLKVSTEQAERQNRRVAVRRVTPLLSRN